MTKLFSALLFLLLSVSMLAQKTSFTPASKSLHHQVLDDKKSLSDPKLFTFDIELLQQQIELAPRRSAGTSSKIISLPSSDGSVSNFRVSENSNFESDLAARYPEIKSYIGQDVNDPTKTVHFSVSPLGLTAMTTKPNTPSEFIEPYSTDNSLYVIYRRSERSGDMPALNCRTIQESTPEITPMFRNANDSYLRTFRLAVSVTGEYTAFFGGTKLLALSAINSTLTRVNAIFERDFATRLVLVNSCDSVIYTNPSTDPYSTGSVGSAGAWNSEVQSTLTTVIGESNYDIGHLFGKSGGGGNAGCLGCVCVNNMKGRGFTSPANGIPAGDYFDIDYVAHELGHQLGATHTFSHNNETSGTQMEPGSGSTIMSYAGITTKDIQRNSDSYFHAISIQQVTNNIKSKTCAIKTPTNNAIPVVNAGADFTIPKGTPFMLTGTATDANGDHLTYCWEQMDNGSATTTVPNATKTTGPNFRSYPPSSSATRYFPQMSSVLNGATTTAGLEVLAESLSSVARSYNFRLTVRDNKSGGGGNNSDDTKITVSASAGPFTVTSPNTAVTFASGSTQTIKWSVAGTTGNGVNCAKVDLLLSTDGGQTYQILLAATPNDGTQNVVIPNKPGTTNRIMIKGTNHVFFDVSNANFTITGSQADTTAPSAPTSLAASNTSQTSTKLTWTASTDNIGVATYSVYRNGTYITSATGTTYTVTGLSPSTSYTFTVKAKDAAQNLSAVSNSVVVTTLSSGPDSTAPSKPTNLTASGTTQNKTTLNWTGSTDNIGVATYSVYRNGTYVASATGTTYTVTGLNPTTTYNFTVKAKDAAGNLSVASNTAVVTTLGNDTVAPSAPTLLTASATTTTGTKLSWNASTDNLGVATYSVYRNGTYIGFSSGTSYTVSGLTASTTYAFTVKAKDAAQNLSAASNTVNVTTLPNQTVTNYCTSTATSAGQESISKVVFGSINMFSIGGAGYTNYTTSSTDVSRGSSYPITITPNWPGTKYAEGYAVFIDFNGDGDFTDSGELVFSKAASTATSVSGSIAIPTSAKLGKTRMRVSMKYNGIPSACEIFPRGQVEDYAINIVNSGRFDEDQDQQIITLFPNPVEGNQLSVGGIIQDTNYRILNMLGQLVSDGKTNNGYVDISGLQSGTFVLQLDIDGELIAKKFIRK